MFLKISDDHVVDDGTTTHQPGDEIEMGAKEGKRLVNLGAGVEIPAPKEKIVTIEDVRDAISLLDTENPRLWTQNNGPQLDALRNVLNTHVTSEQRDEAWKLHKEAKE